jgi:hypothetical protein
MPLRSALPCRNRCSRRHKEERRRTGNGQLLAGKASLFSTSGNDSADIVFDQPDFDETSGACQWVENPVAAGEKIACIGEEKDV